MSDRDGIFLFYYSFLPEQDMDIMIVLVNMLSTLKYPNKLDKALLYLSTKICFIWSLFSEIARLCKDLTIGKPK